MVLQNLNDEREDVDKLGMVWVHSNSYQTRSLSIPSEKGHYSFNDYKREQKITMMLKIFLTDGKFLRKARCTTIGTSRVFLAILASYIT